MFDFSSFSHGQIASKIWLCEEVEKFLPNPARIALLGGWYGMTAFLLFTRGNAKIDYVRSFDIDPKVEQYADKINNSWVFESWKFKAVTLDANQIDFSDFNVVINTSSEHIISREWFDKLTDQLIVIQSTDQIHDDNDEHDYCFSLEQLKQKYKMTYFFEDEKKFVYPTKCFSRFMLVGRKL